MKAAAYRRPEMKDCTTATMEDSLIFSHIRDIAPSPLLADIACLNYWNIIYRHSGPDKAAIFLKPQLEATVIPEIRAEYVWMMPAIGRLCAGEDAPSITLNDVDGRAYTLDDFRGKYLYLDFWDFGCKPCISEFAVVPELKSYFGDRINDIEIVTVCSSRPSRKKLEEFAIKHGMTERNLMLDRKKSDQCYNVSVFPTYVLIDPDGKIVEFNTARPSEILEKSKAGIPTPFETAITPGK